ncbi:MAG: ABC transporter ATP-binding protein [Anaerolineae bacterium]
MATIRLVNVTKYYYKGHSPGIIEPPEEERIVALDGVNLEVREGETMSVVGPSGCGKTTLLRIVAGLEHPDGGYVTYDGEDVRHVQPGDRGIGIVFQNYALYPHMESQENIGFFFRLHKREDEIPERVRTVSKIMGVGFEHLLSRKPPTLSGGERQRVAVARCIARDPRLFLFDEPLSNLDARLRVKTRGELKRILARYATTGIYVTHDQQEAIALGDRIAVMREGRIEQVGPYLDVYRRPANLFVAEFIGLPPMNTFYGYINDMGEWVGDDFRWPDVRPDLHEGDRVALGVRPEHIVVQGNGAGISAYVELVEPLFSERAHLLYTKIGRTTCRVRVPASVAVRAHETVRLTFDPERVYLFDLKTGRRLS